MSNVKFLLARKKGMTQFFREDGTVVPVTVLEAGPCTVTAVRTPERDGYAAVQIGFLPARAKHVHKPQQKAAEKAGVGLFRVQREFRLDSPNGFRPGQELKADVFGPGDMVDVSGTSKGKGFAGTIKAHHFNQGPESHGCMNVRQPGSIGSSADPARVLRGLRMARHLGAARATLRNLVIVGVDQELGVILVRGGVPGPPNGVIELVSAGSPTLAARRRGEAAVKAPEKADKGGKKDARPAAKGAK
ncbi:MAG: 50S ribosomal protein L3 [Planctomycetota bacterium]|nr:MAG: 50S ribosomal protein L3 [Planctomycetota bacterium]